MPFIYFYPKELQVRPAWDLTAGEEVEMNARAPFFYIQAPLIYLQEPLHRIRYRTLEACVSVLELH